MSGEIDAVARATSRRLLALPSHLQAQALEEVLERPVDTNAPDWALNACREVVWTRFGVLLLALAVARIEAR